MQEYITRAVVLDIEPIKELDDRFSLYTEKYGKLKPRTTSTHKITSKLIGHLQPGYITNVRLVERRGLRLVDALKQGKSGTSPVKLYLLDQLLHEAEPDEEIWNLLTNGDFSWVQMLGVLGWDPTHATCAKCGRLFVMVQKCDLTMHDRPHFSMSYRDIVS